MVPPRKWAALLGREAGSSHQGDRKADGAQRSPGSCLPLRRLRPHSFLEFPWQGSLPSPLSSRASNQVMGLGGRSPGKGEEGRCDCGTGQPEQTGTPRTVHTCVLDFSFHFFTEWAPRVYLKAASRLCLARPDGARGRKEAVLSEEEGPFMASSSHRSFTGHSCFLRVDEQGRPMTLGHG